MKETVYRLPAILFLLAFLMPSVPAAAQPWNDFVDKTFVFQINNKEAGKLLQSSPRDSLIKQMLHTQVGEFIDQWTERPEQGHFLFADIVRNRVDYRYVPVMPFKVFLYKEYGILTLQVVDEQGNIRPDAKVRITAKRKLFNKRVRFDGESQVYRIDDWSEKRYRVLTVELNGFRAVFDLTKHLVSPYYNWYDEGFYSPDFYSYMITDKNKYKPGETVRFKSYALTGSRRPLKKDLEIWVRTENWRYKKVGTLPPYNPGGYAGEVHLHDSLGLKLDRYYDIQLREPRGRIVAAQSFKYEDYVLYDNKLEIEVAESIHYYPDENEITVKVTDANGLLALDVKADVAVMRRSVDRSFTDVLIVADTLMHELISLDNDAPTRVTIPSGIFGEANGMYSVEVSVLTYDGQLMQASEMVYYRRGWKEMQVSTRGDTVRFEYFETGKPVRVRAELQYDDKGVRKSVDLPYEERFDQSIGSYRFRIPDREFEQSLPVHLIDEGLRFEGGFEKDSFKVKMINPLDLEVSWYVYRGNILLEKGAGREMSFAAHEPAHDVAFYAEAFYFMGGSEQSHRRTFLPQKEQLTIELDMPDRIYPGQTLDATVSVTDNLGRPVRKADLTAFAYNNLLDYYVPDMEYYGADPKTREKRSSYSIDRRGYRFDNKVDYDFWRERARLDSLPYYRFIYPKNTLFTSTTPTPDGITQMAPYVMRGGESQEVYVIEVNDRPVWFSWTEQPQAYSFPVCDTVKNNIRLRLCDRVILLDSLEFEAGKKTILSVDIDALPREARIIRFNGYGFTSAESNRYSSLISRLPVEGADKQRYIRHYKGDSVLVYHPLLSSVRNSNVLTGPVKPGSSRYGNSVEYYHEGGYRYRFSDNVVYKLDTDVLPRSFYPRSDSRITNLGDFYLSPQVVGKKSEEILWRRNFWQPAAIYISQKRMQMKFRIPEKADTTGIANLIFLDRDSDTTRIIYPDKYESDRRTYSDITPGNYDAVLIYNNGRYIRYDSLGFEYDKYIEVDMGAAPLCEADSISLAWRNTYSMPSKVGDSFVSPRNSRLYYFRAPVDSWSVIRGYVVDRYGEPVIGATVLIKGTSIGTITNLDGYFELQTETGNADLVVTFLGYTTHEITVNAGSLVHIVLEEDSQMLEEVVVIGYGTSSKSSIAGFASRTAADVSGSIPDEDLQDDEGESLTADKDAEDRLYRELIGLGGIRSNFSDVGFWQPSLVTDRRGKASFTVTFPDNITKWDAVVYAMNRRLQTGTYRQSIRSYKPLMAELRMPGFLVEGDVSRFAGNLRNYTSDELVTGTATFTQNGDTLSSKTVEFATSLPGYMDFTAPENSDSLKASYIFSRADGYLDGEERTIAIIPRGTEIAEGQLDFLRTDETVDITAGENETVEVTVTGNQLDVYLDAAYYLHGYKYACNEQLASKLIGLMQIKLYREFNGETKFPYDRQVNDIIRRLAGNRNGDMLWSWFGNSPNTSFWMSAHIMRALKMAREQGYTVNLDFSRLQYDYTDVQPYREPRYSDIEILHVLSEMEAAQNYGPAVEYWENRIAREEFLQDSIAAVKKDYYKTSYLHEKLLLWDIRRMQGLEYDPGQIEAYLKTDILGGVYCDDGIPRHWYNDALSTTLAAYKIVRADSSLIRYREPMQMYVLGTKRYGWNTYYGASAIATIFPDLISAGREGTPPAGLAVSGVENGTVTRFPYQRKLAPGETLSLTKTGSVPLIYSSYTRSLVTEERTGDGFEISTSIADGPRLTVGKQVTLEVKVKVKQKNAEYVMIEVPIPAGCDYASKHQNYYGREVHREHFKEKAVIFCESLPEGEYTYRIELLPRFSGTYTLNPAKVELMYFPVVSSNNDIRQVTLQQQ